MRTQDHFNQGKVSEATAGYTDEKGCLIADDIRHSSINSSSASDYMSDDSQLIHALFPEVLAGVSADHSESQPMRTGPLGLKLSLADVSRAWQNRSRPAKQPALSTKSAMVTFEALHIPTAKDALEITCGPFPCYDLSQATFVGSPLRGMHVQQPQRGSNGSGVQLEGVPTTPGHKDPRVDVKDSQPFMFRQDGFNTSTTHGLCSQGSISLCSSPVSDSAAINFMQPFVNLADVSAMEEDTPCLDPHVSCLNADLEELASSFAPARSHCPEGFDMLLSDSDDGSDGTHLSGSNLWADAQDAYDSIFGNADAAASSDDNSCHSMIAANDAFLLTRVSRHASSPASTSANTIETFDAAISQQPAIVPELLPSASVNGAEFLPAVVSSHTIGNPVNYHDHDGPLIFAKTMPAMSSQCGSMLPVLSAPFYHDATLAQLPLSLAAIPAKTADCARSARAACAAKCKEKRRHRHPSKICYEMRKINADMRPRYKGRFVKRVEMLVQQSEQETQATIAAMNSSEDVATCFTYTADPIFDEICPLSG